jgi:acetylornithine deacetylase/succinyl-diaminopimelate desuccinylase-like protein
MELAFRGKSGHAARPSSYDNPIYRLASCITALERKFPNANPSATVCSLTTIHGGNALNQVPDDATLTIDVRYVPTDDPVAIEQTVKSIAKQFNGSCKRLVCEPAFVIDSLNPFVQEFIKVYEGYTGRHVRAIEAPGSSDARFFSNKGVPVIMIRPEGGGLHGPDEYISLASLAEFTDILGIYLEKFER